MSEYQYYEFQAIDRPLTKADRQALRDLSTRARITATSFTNSYEWGDFKGDPAKLMERWFDLHLYLANWGSRRLMMRFPTRLIDRDRLDAFLEEVDCVRLRAVGENLILDIARDEVEFDDWDDGSGWLAALLPLRAEVLSGDLRLFYLLWLMAVEVDALEANETEPMPGIGPMTGALEAFTDFFGIESDLVQAAAKRPAVASLDVMSSDAVRKVIAAMPDREKTRLLERLFEDDPQVAAELRATVRKGLDLKTETSPTAPRTVGELRIRADAIRLSRERAEADKVAEERRRQADAAEKALHTRLEAIRHRGEVSGGRSRPKSSAATQPATTRRLPFCPISERSPRSRARSTNSFAGSTRSASGTPGRSDSSKGWRRSESTARHSVELAGHDRR